MGHVPQGARATAPEHGTVPAEGTPGRGGTARPRTGFPPAAPRPLQISSWALPRRRGAVPSRRKRSGHLVPQRPPDPGAKTSGGREPRAGSCCPAGPGPRAGRSSLAGRPLQPGVPNSPRSAGLAPRRQDAICRIRANSEPPARGEAAVAPAPAAEPLREPKLLLLCPKITPSRQEKLLRGGTSTRSRTENRSVPRPGHRTRRTGILRLGKLRHGGRRSSLPDLKAAQKKNHFHLLQHHARPQARAKVPRSPSRCGSSTALPSPTLLPCHFRAGGCRPLAAPGNAGFRDRHGAAPLFLFLQPSSRSSGNPVTKRRCAEGGKAPKIVVWAVKTPRSAASAPRSGAAGPSRPPREAGRGARIGAEPGRGSSPGRAAKPELGGERPVAKQTTPR